ncbi:MAG TPA: aconitase family protein [Polyangiaceae bacterium]|jgi:3-isopropylmalate/(R)-2-methylmalate dehydratase large subunit
MSQATLKLTGRVLYLTEDPELLRRQFAGETLHFAAARALLANISTDELTPAWACYYYDQTLARYCLVGLRGGLVARDAVKNGGFQVIVSGPSKGCGSSRETAPYAELASGVRVVFAPSFEKIYLQNCQNIGLLTSTDFSLLERLEHGEAIELREFARDLSPISGAIVEAGGLFAYNAARLAGKLKPELPAHAPRPMTLAEKILAAHAVRDAEHGELGLPAVRPRDAFFARADLRFSHEYVTPMADALFRAGFGEGAKVADPDSLVLFRDHLTFLERVMPEKHRALGLVEQSRELVTVQREFAARHGVRLFGEVERDGKNAGSEAICHNKVIEDLALPGELVIGTDSHTCMAGVLGCFAFGVGSTDMANAWLTRDVRVDVPESVRVILRGELRPGVCAKDAMLFLLAEPGIKAGGAVGKVLEFEGPGLKQMSLGERATLTNMSVEAGAFTGIIAADEVVIEYLLAQRGLPRSELEARVVRADAGAEYARTIELDLSQIPVMVALPSDPRAGIALSELEQTVGSEVRVDIAYGGSCTGGKISDMDLYAGVIREALERGLRVHPNVRFYLQFGSQSVRRYALERGYIELFERIGASLLEPSCGACIRAGPGTSTSETEVTISAVNRNFPGRSGPGRVYLASPRVVAASAIAGKIVAELPA